ncbi:MAG TPA: LPS assembly protein LptD [Candidatus Polarisedimenticolaceae bacterium]|nr:LPS assembly protein LptD [Candidatus Polarisedimenticolaceae bacterium]
MPPRLHALIVLFVLLGATEAALAAKTPKPARPAPADSMKGTADKTQAVGLPSGVSLSALTIRQDAKDGTIVAEGEVTIESGGGRIQADRVTFRERHIVEAEGNVLIVWDGNRISGTRMVYDMGIKDDPDPQKRITRGVIENAIGQVDPEFYFEARQVDTIGEDHVVLHHAQVTTCTQPVPYWSFHVTKAKIKINGYAHLFNLRPAVGKVPFFYLPWLMWPVKRDRAPGLLFPEFGTATTRGRLLSIPVFVPLGPSADVTFDPQWYSIGGLGLGAKLRVVPNRDGYMEATVNYVWDRVSGEENVNSAGVPDPVPFIGRYRALFKQTQTFLNGFRMVSDIDVVSDFNYYTDFVRNLTYSSTPTILGRVSFTKSGKWTSLLIQEQYREQLFPPTTFVDASGNLVTQQSTLTQSTLPEIQWRGRSTRLGKSPFFLSFVSSFDNIRQKGARLETDYMRGDVSPTISLPWSPTPWLDVTPAVTYRSTYWTKQQDQGPADPTTGVLPNPTILSQGLWRNLFGASLDIRGPKLYKIFEKDGKPDKDGNKTKKKLKNTIEPRLLYTYQQSFDKTSDVIVYDDVDAFGITANSLSYGLTSRFIAQRPRAGPEAPGLTGEKILAPEGESGKLREVAEATPPEQPAEAVAPGTTPAEGQPPAPLEPVEIASLDLLQTYSLNSNGSTIDRNGDGKIDDMSKFSAVTLTGRYNPKTYANFSLSTRYDVLFENVSEIAVSGNFRERLARGLFSAVYHPGLGLQPTSIRDPNCTNIDPTTCPYVTIYVPKKDATQLRFQGDFGPLLERIRLGMDATYNVTPQPGEKKLPYQRWRMEYYTQCCGFLAEYLQYNYTTAPRKEFRFAVDLRGIGKLFDFNQANQ